MWQKNWNVFSNCQITFASGQEFDNLITGEHDNKSLESVLKSIEFISDINYKKEGRNILLLKNEIKKIDQCFNPFNKVQNESINPLETP